MKIRYFAWVRERIGRPEEDLDIPPHVGTITELAEWLSSRGEEYALAFEHRGVVRAAIDQVHARPDASITGAREIAFFPPMTGG